MQINYGKNPNTLSTHTKTTNKKNRSSIIKWLILLLMLFAALYFYRDSLHEIFEGVKALSAKTICVTFLFSFVYFITEGLIITIMAKPFSASFHFYNGISTAYICEFYRLLTLGSGAGIAELYYLQKGGVSYPNGIGTSMLQFVMKKIGIMTFGVIGFFFLLQHPVTKEVLHSYYGAMAGGCVVTILIVAALLIVTLSDAVKNLFLRILERIGNKFVTYQEKLEKLSENLILLNAAGKEVLTHKLRFLVIILLNLFKFFAIYAIPAYVLIGQCTLSVTEGIMLMAISYMLAGVLPAPSGIGSLEFVFLLFFTRFAKESTAVPAILVFRLMIWIVPFAIGGILSLLHASPAKKSV